MTDQRSQAELVRQSLKRRYRKERRFRAYGIAAIAIALSALVILFADIIGKGHTAFIKTTVTLEVDIDGEAMYLDDASDERQMKMADFVEPLIRALMKEIPEAGESDRDDVRDLINPYASNQLRDALRENPELLNTTQTMTFLSHTDVDVYVKHAGDENYSIKLNEKQQAWVDALYERGVVDTGFNDVFFSRGDSRDPSRAGILGAIVGSLLTMVVTLALSFPIGVAAAIYLEEFAPQNKLTDFIEVNINNLAAVPSIIFGLLGLAVFINLFGMPRSVPVVGGLVLTLMTLPTIIISSRAAIKSVPPSIREAAEGIGASKMQVVLHHVLPLAMPGMLTGSIIGMAQALGETAPLLLIGMVAFIVDVPDGFFDSATVLPVQVFLWAGSPELAFIERASAAIMVLLTFLIGMNALAIWLRKRLERRW
ncbi:MAG TPA: phosphate ABC transporter permease PtsA [Marinobacter hydrocarbonoclasticus]|jgi:phosphate transport system permease protein|uniref:Phosphate transport system permease protein PstA n=4 Tax=Marinobacter nauticus TaxID=2743 RepID=A0A350RSL1_MARNT|nr:MULTISPECIES: phosphate ABC transporter permease PstA [Marinobacter]MAP31730.1 phosphate ABC transporter, permease protein PstA [Marinobacter sp.]MEC9040175.1 phosphate ABC transporter permease PstA [Pseudomonadota bacterium]MBY6103774.1 phosphate ABC transporter permease PstA [Marinobacter nauticus]MCS5561021.1 phosphate ABC transporter permease PstA [Marinobacter nauticus]MEC9082224.1 phosphate ABC transporter permease PstA [Pseudomonadota bacterium]|tara:strand:- start:1783 stop:3057 length:1275 start_codon:yes stop_codon:yes gene_type:complete